MFYIFSGEFPCSLLKKSLIKVRRKHLYYIYANTIAMGVVFAYFSSLKGWVSRVFLNINSYYYTENHLVRRIATFNLLRFLFLKREMIRSSEKKLLVEL